MLDSSQIKVAVLGCGYWGKNLVRNFHALGSLALVCDPSETGRQSAVGIAPGVETVPAFDRVMTDPRVTAVAISTPAATHYAMARSALIAGKDVYVEKPLCLQLDQADELVSLAESLGRILMVGHLLRYHPCVEALQSLVVKGELGQLYYIASNRLNLGKIRREENALWSFAPHDISVILALAGDHLPQSVRCTGGTYLSHGVADTSLTSLSFERGIRAHIFVSWLNPFKEQKLTVVGSAGMAVFDDARPWPEKLVITRDYLERGDGGLTSPIKVTPEPVIVDESEPLRAECRHFLESCRTRLLPRTDGREGVRVLSVLHAAQRSLDTDGEAFSPADLQAVPAA